MLGVMVGHVLKLPALIALIQVSSVGKPAAACRYRTVWLIEGRSYTLFALSFFVLSTADIIHNFAPFDLHPWRTGGSVVVIEMVPCLCTVTPSSLGWNIVVYPSSDILLMLTSGVFSPGRMSASLAFWLSCLSGSSVRYVACSLVLPGKYTSLFDFPFFGKSVSSGTKFEVASESIINFIARLLSIQRIHLLPFAFAIDCFVSIILICSCSSDSSASSWSGAQ